MPGVVYIKLHHIRGLFEAMNIMHGGGNVHTATSRALFCSVNSLIRIELFVGFRSVCVFSQLYMSLLPNFGVKEDNCLRAISSIV